MELKEFNDKLLHGIHLAQKRMFEEKALRGEIIVLGDSNGKPYEMKASDYLEKNKDFFASVGELRS